MHHYRRQRRGSYAIIVALLLVVLLGFAALAIDLSYLRLARLQAQNAADAGAHAALTEFRLTRSEDAARARAAQFVNLNYIAGDRALVEPETDVIFGGWDFPSHSFNPDADYVNAVEVTVRREADAPGGSVPLMLARIFGATEADARSNGSSVGALRSREIFIVQDVTSSFRDEIGQGRAADLTLLDFINENGFPGDRIGMVTFVGAAEVWTDLQRVEPNYSSIRSQWSTLDWCNRNYWPFTTPAWSEYYHDAPQMISCNEGTTGAWYSDSGTSQGHGLALAIDQLVDDETTEQTALKTIVLISDGKPQCVPEGTSCDDEVAAYGLAQANRAGDESISVFSVSFNETYNEEQSAYLEACEECGDAPDPDTVEYFDAHIHALNAAVRLHDGPALDAAVVDDKVNDLAGDSSSMLTLTVPAPHRNVNTATATPR